MLFELIIKVDEKTLLSASFTGWLSDEVFRYDGNLKVECDNIDDALFILRSFEEEIKKKRVLEKLETIAERLLNDPEVKKLVEKYQRKCKKCGHEARFSDYGLPDDFAEIAKKIGSLKGVRVAAVILCTNPEKFEICNEPCSAGGLACEFKKTVWVKGDV